MFPRNQRLELNNESGVRELAVTALNVSVLSVHGIFQLVLGHIRCYLK